MSSQLSLEQAPPPSVVFRFFITAPLFGILAGLLLMTANDADFLYRSTPLLLSLTHLLTLGAIGLVQAGALLQVLPVIAGAVIRKPVLAAWLVHPALTLGSLFLVTGFYRKQNDLLIIGGNLLAWGFTALLIFLSIALWKTKTRSTTVTGLWLALLGLLITLILGLGLVSIRSDVITELGLIIVSSDAINTHPLSGLLAWTLVLIFTVSYQVVPMFQITPAYPLWLTRSWAPLLMVSVVVVLLAQALNPHLLNPVSLGAEILILGILTGFVLATLNLQRQKKRKRNDTTFNYWRLGMISLLACVLLWIIQDFLPSNLRNILPGWLFLTGFAIPITTGMLYKILPFLVWLHLKNQQMKLGLIRKVRIPLMPEVIPSKHQKLQFYIYVLALACLMVTPFQPDIFAIIAGSLFVASQILLLWHLLLAIRTFKRYTILLTIKSPIQTTETRPTSSNSSP